MPILISTGPISNVKFSGAADDAPATLDELLVHLIVPHTGKSRNVMGHENPS
jgi:hypothetical protein